MKKITSWLLTVAMIATMFTAVPVSAETTTGFAGGTGTKDDPFLISNVAELNYLNEVVNTGATYEDAEGTTKNYYQAAYKLTADIDYGNGEWTPLGWVLPVSYNTANSTVVRTPAFSGTFDGGNHVIKNVKITNSDTSNTSKTSQHVGFFGRTNDATIKNLGLNNIDIQWANHDYKYDTVNNKTERAQYYGAFVGSMAITNISNCYVVNSKVKNTNGGINDSGLGGFVGAMDYTNSISYCYVYNTEVRSANAKTQAGFVGNCLSGSNVVNNSYAAKITTDRTSTFPTTYGFGYNSRTDVTTNAANNCWSTLADAQGTYCANYGYAMAYKPASSLGVSGATSDALIEAMLATGMYESKATVNDGFPYLKTGFDGTVATSYDGGSGTADDPFQIATPGQLLLASKKVYAGVHNQSHFILTSDIDFNNQPWEPIGWSGVNGDHHFCGTFDGNNHVVKNLTLADGEYHYAGFFGLLTGAVVKDLGVENFQLVRKNTAGNNIRVVGGFVGSARSTNAGVGTTITNCYVKNSSVHQTQNYGASSSGVYIDTNLGGFIGTVDMRYCSTEIKDCYVENVSLYTAIQGEACGFIGGVTEYSNASAKPVKLTNCYAANVTNGRNSTVTTLVGFGYTGSESTIFNAEKIVVSNCYSTFTTRQGTDTNASKIKDGIYFGTEGADKTTIVNAFENLNGWQVNANINDGYPCLDFEIPPEKADYAIKSVNKEIVQLNVSGSSGSYTSNPATDCKVTVAIDRKPGVTGTANVYVAGYDATGRLTGADVATVDKNTFSYTANINGETATVVKVFVWNENQTPLIDEPYVATTSRLTPLEEVWTYKVDSNEPVRKTRFVMIGDSLMDSTATGTGNGWERFIGDYLADNTTVLKHGHSGSTVQMLINGRTTDKHTCSWETIRNEFGSGDVVILGLGTNDASRINGTFSDATQHYSVDQFKAWYKEIIADVKAKGATIVLLTPPPNSGSVSNVEFYDPESTPRTAIKEVASETGVTVLDTTKLYADAINAYGVENGYTAAEMKATVDGSGNTIAQGIIFRDYLHFTAVGADLMAKTVATELAKIAGIKNFVVLQ